MNSRLVAGVVVSLLITLIALDSFRAFRSSHTVLPQSPIVPFWKYECIDTMKTSRDLVGQQLKNNALMADIEKEVRLIAESGANCVAVATPYDSEFLPILRTWVLKARESKLHVWFRGNWSGWEGWYGRKAVLSPEQHLVQTKQFILQNKDLFADGDIFTGAPEAENGGPFVDNISAETFPEYRAFLIDQYNLAQETFREIGVSVTVNWFSMNGWVAKNMYNSRTLDVIGNNVTIDHYTAGVSGMDEYIRYFNDTYNSSVTLGEFGAPIPDLNGEMNESEQAAFVDSLFGVFYKNREHIAGMSYWTLRFGSTRLVNDNFTKREVFSTIQRYYNPAMVYGRVITPAGDGVANVRISSSSFDISVISDANGFYSMQLPSGYVSTEVVSSGFVPLTRSIVLQPGEDSINYFTVHKKTESLFDSVRYSYLQFFLPRS